MSNMIKWFKNLFKKSKDQEKVFQGSVERVSKTVTSTELAKFNSWLDDQIKSGKQKGYSNLVKYLAKHSVTVIPVPESFPLELEFDIPNDDLMKLFKTLKLLKCKISNKEFQQYIEYHLNETK